jgi:hypothetical protein
MALPRRLVESPRVATEMAPMAMASQPPTAEVMTAQATAMSKPACAQRLRLRARLQPLKVDALRAHLVHRAARSPLLKHRLVLAHQGLSRQPKAAQDPAKAVAACAQMQPAMCLVSNPIGLAVRVAQSVQIQRAVRIEPALPIGQRFRLAQSHRAEPPVAADSRQSWRTVVKVLRSLPKGWVVPAQRSQAEASGWETRQCVHP